jgi:adenylate cyclase
MSLFAELKRRSVFRVALFYLVLAWLVVQVAETVLPLFDVPPGMLRGLVLVLGLGFPPALIFAWVYELTPDGLKRDSQVDLPPAVREQSARKLSWATLTVALLAIGLLAADRLLFEPGGRRSATAEPASPLAGDGTGAGVHPASIAVLPFADLSPGKDQEYFSDGMAEEILNALVRVRGLDVASRTSSFGFKGQEHLGIPDIAGRLGVRHVLEGSVRRAGDSLRITAQLIDADVDRHLWSGTFDRPLTAGNVFAVQEEIATAIVAALVESLDMGATPAVALDVPTDNLPAYDLYLQARGLFQARDALDRADDLLQRALEQDPRFARAWELRAALHSIAKEYGYSDLPKEELERLTIEFAREALAIDPASGMALAALAHQKSQAMQSLRARHEIAEIVRDLERSLEIDPRNASALNWLGLVFGHVGRLEDALATFRRCIDHEPFFAPCAENEYETLMGLGRLDDAWAHFEAALSQGRVTHQYVNFHLLARFEQKSAFMIAANQSLWLPGWRRHEEVYEAMRHPERDHSALVTDLMEFVQEKPGAGAGYIENLLLPLGAYDQLLPFPLLMWGPDYVGYRRSPQFRDYIHRSGVFDYWREQGYPPQCRPRGARDFQCD